VVRARADGNHRLLLTPAEAAFVVGERDPDCILECRVEAFSPLLAPPLYDTPGLWAYSEAQGARIFHLRTAGRETRRATMAPDLSCGQVLCAPELVKGTPEGLGAEFLAHPLLEILTYWRLLVMGGLPVHACGVVYEGRGMLFCGVSGAGKSTLSELWAARGATVLSDDRIGLRRSDGGAWEMHGTPWHGTAAYALPQSASLSAVYFIEHAADNEALALPAAEAAGLLLALSFAPPFDPGLLAAGMSAAADVVQQVPCVRFGFAPHDSALDAAWAVVNGPRRPLVSH
jgi:hypothetical protein